MFVKGVLCINISLKVECFLTVVILFAFSQFIKKFLCNPSWATIWVATINYFVKLSKTTITVVWRDNRKSTIIAMSWGEKSFSL